MQKSVSSPSNALQWIAFTLCMLGLMQEYCKIALWLLLECGEWGAHCSNQTERLEAAILCLRAELRNFCAQLKESVTPPHDLTMKMVGKPADPKLKHLSGAETWAMLQYLNHAMAKHAAKVGPQAATIGEAGKMLDKTHRLSRETSGKVPVRIQQDVHLNFIIYI